MEIWKSIFRFDNYQISNLGNIKRLGGWYYRGLDGKLCYRKEKILTPKLNKNGYLRIGIRKEDLRIYFSIHRLVACEFIENENQKPKWSRSPTIVEW